MSRWIPTGCALLDRALDGGISPNEITLIYGEAETGKTSLAMQCAVNSARMGYKTLFVDSDGTFSPERLFQIATQDFREVVDAIIIVRPSTFDEQATIIDNLDRYVSKNFGLIVFDTITSLYRSELKSKEESFKLNRELNRQVATLAQIAKTLRISILLISQVRSVLSLEKVGVEPVATRVLKFWSSTIIGLTRENRRNLIKARVERICRKKKRLTLHLIIERDGIRDYKQVTSSF